MVFYVLHNVLSVLAHNIAIYYRIIYNIGAKKVLFEGGLGVLHQNSF